MKEALEKNQSREWEGVCDTMTLHWALKTLSGWYLSGDQWGCGEYVRALSGGRTFHRRNKGKGRNMVTVFYKPHGEHCGHRGLSEGKGKELRCRPERDSFTITESSVTCTYRHGKLVLELFEWKKKPIQVMIITIALLICFVCSQLYYYSINAYH